MYDKTDQVWDQEYEIITYTYIYMYIPVVTSSHATTKLVLKKSYSHHNYSCCSSDLPLSSGICSALTSLSFEELWKKTA